jgi:hypothetical protein
MEWSLRLLADKVVELGFYEHISPIRRCVQFSKKQLKPHLKQTGCIGTLDSRFLARIEVLLALYSCLIENRTQPIPSAFCGLLFRSSLLFLGM